MVTPKERMTACCSAGGECFTRGEFRKSARYYRMALACFYRIPPDDRPSGVADIYNWLGLSSKRAGHLTEATQAYIQALEQTPNDTTYLNNLSICLMELAEFNQAVVLISQVLGMPNSSSNRAFYQVNAACIHTRYGDYQAAYQLIKPAIQYYNTRYPVRDSNTAHAFYRLGSLLVELGYYNDALFILNKAHADFVQCYGAHHSRTMEIQHHIAELHALAGNWRQAQTLSVQALAHFIKNYAMASPQVVRAMLTLAECKLELEGPDAILTTRAYLKNTGRLLWQTYRKLNHPDFAVYFRLRGEWYYRTGHHTLARKCYSRALSILRRTCCAGHRFFVPVYHRLGDLSGEKRTALRYYKLARQNAQTQAAVHPLLPDILTRIEQLTTSQSVKYECRETRRKFESESHVLKTDTPIDPQTISLLHHECRRKPGLRLILIATPDKITRMHDMHQRLIPILDYYRNEMAVDLIRSDHFNPESLTISYSAELLVAFLGRQYSGDSLSPAIVCGYPDISDYRDRPGWEILLRYFLPRVQQRLLFTRYNRFANSRIDAELADLKIRYPLDWFYGKPDLQTCVHLLNQRLLQMIDNLNVSDPNS